MKFPLVRNFLNSALLTMARAALIRRGYQRRARASWCGPGKTVRTSIPILPIAYFPVGAARVARPIGGDPHRLVAAARCAATHPIAWSPTRVRESEHDDLGAEDLEGSVNGNRSAVR